jgi:glycolate oxidase
VVASKQAVIDGLTEIVGDGNVHVAGNRFSLASQDATEIIQAPLAAAEIEAAEQIPRLIRFCAEQKISLVVRGLGSGLSGGSLAGEDTIVLLFDRLDRILSLDVRAGLAIVEPGVITQDLADAAAREGLFYPPDPASVAESTIGGNVAECAGGMRCKKYGVTRDYVLGIEGYDGDGELVQTGYFAEEQTYNLTDLLSGSEGTLAVMTKFAMKLIDPPEARRTMLAAYATSESVATVVAEVLAKGIVPSVMEFMDGDAIACSLDYLEHQHELTLDDSLTVALKSQALLLIELDGNLEEIERDGELLEEIIRKQEPLMSETADEESRREMLWSIRRSLSKAVTAAAPVRVSEDVCVPPSRLPELVAVLPVMAAAYGLRVNSYGHVGDGNLHVNFLAAEDSEESHARIHDAAVELFKTTIELEGTISGEHGIGIAKKKYLPLEVSPETMDLFRKIKRAFDPKGLINPRKIFD